PNKLRGGNNYILSCEALAMNNTCLLKCMRQSSIEHAKLTDSSLKLHPSLLNAKDKAEARTTSRATSTIPSQVSHDAQSVMPTPHSQRAI
ncbi:hypothetical protein O988_04091, partial [Pseudogymnoascus sp. VKM F-3808]